MSDFRYDTNSSFLCGYVYHPTEMGLFTLIHNSGGTEEQVLRGLTTWFGHYIFKCKPSIDMPLAEWMAHPATVVPTFLCAVKDSSCEMVITIGHAGRLIMQKPISKVTNEREPVDRSVLAGLKKRGYQVVIKSYESQDDTIEFTAMNCLREATRLRVSGRSTLADKRESARVDECLTIFGRHRDTIEMQSRMIAELEARQLIEGDPSPIDAFLEEEE